jgi:ubiquinone/menaquinone biosynthesis C-methylase UbiE
LIIPKKCNCCSSEEISSGAINIDGYFICMSCGLLFYEHSKNCNNRKKLIKHYSNLDPHKSVANAKRKLFKYLLEMLENETVHLEKTILDIGCGFGYFVDTATKRGWDTIGVEISAKAAQGAKEKIGNSKVYHGNLKEANFDDKSFDAITLWDVLVEIDDPFDEMIECFRILKDKGKIGIRVRNLYFQKIAYRFYKLLKKIKLETRLKKPYVFHKYCYSRKSIYLLLSRAGFQNIRIINSPLTDGDPYQYVKYYKIINIAKIICKIVSDIIFWSSFGKLVVGPSLLVWAEKPIKTE